MEETLALRILLVSSDAVVPLTVRRSLSNASSMADVVVVETCEGAIEILQQQPLDCLLLDDRLPVSDELQLVKQTKQLGITVLLVMLAEQSDEQRAVELMEAGATDDLATQRFLADASYVLAASLDYQTILNNIAQLAVPTLADCCFFDILTSQNTFQCLTWQNRRAAR